MQYESGEIMNCACHPEIASSESTTHLLSFDALHIARLLGQTNQAIAQISGNAKAAMGTGPGILAGQPSPVLTEVHVPKEGGLLVSSSYSVGNEGDIVLRGTIGPFPYELHLRIQIEGTAVTVRLELTKPFQAGPFEYKFQLGGIVLDKNNAIIAASSVQPATDMAAAPKGVLGLNWWCVLRCGGLSILAILVKCLPALSGGIPGYIACVTAQAGAGAAEIAVCIATKCA